MYGTSLLCQLIDLDVENQTCCWRFICIPAIEKLCEFLRLLSLLCDGIIPNLRTLLFYTDNSKELHLLEIFPPKNPYPLILLEVLLVGPDQILL